MNLIIAMIVRDYDEATDFRVDKLAIELLNGTDRSERVKRWFNWRAVQSAAVAPLLKGATHGAA